MVLTADKPVIGPQQDPLRNMEPVGSPRRKCIDSGGTWINGACVFPEKVDTTKQETAEGSGIFEDVPLESVSKQPKEGEAPFAFSKPNAQEMQDFLRAKEGRESVGTEKRRLGEATEILAGFEEGPTFEERVAEAELSDIFNKQTALAGGKGALDTAISRAGILASTFGSAALIGGQLGPQAATPEEVVTVPAAAGIGAGVGFVWGLAEGFWKGASSNAASQARGQTGARAKTIRAVKTDMTRDVSTMWSGRGNKADLAANFHKRRNDAWDAYAQLTVDVRRGVNLAMGEDGTVILQQYKEFFAPGGQDEMLMEEMKTALFSAPNIERADQLFAEANNEAILAALELAAK